jgi:hypothetical protein
MMALSKLRHITQQPDLSPTKCENQMQHNVQNQSARIFGRDVQKERDLPYFARGSAVLSIFCGVTGRQ